MADMTHGREGRPPLSFGISVTPTAQAYPEIVTQVQAAERGGLDLVGIQDHPYQRRFLDTFALIADLLARTSRLRFFPDVASLPMRPPTMLAKAAASLDVMSGGRFELGIGAGSFWQAVTGMGGPDRATVDDRVEALEEAIRILRAVFDGERVVRGPGRHYTVPGYPPGPPPAHRIEIWVGAGIPRTLELIGRLADGWIPPFGAAAISGFPAAAARIDDAANAAGRDPAAIRRILNISGEITDGARRDALLVGPVDLWVETLAQWALELGVDAFIVWPPDTGTRTIERFAAEVVPAVSEAVAPEGRTGDR